MLTGLSEMTAGSSDDKNKSELDMRSYNPAGRKGYDTDMGATVSRELKGHMSNVISLITSRFCSSPAKAECFITNRSCIRMEVWFRSLIYRRRLTICRQYSRCTCCKLGGDVELAHVLNQLRIILATTVRLETLYKDAVACYQMSTGLLRTMKWCKQARAFPLAALWVLNGILLHSITSLGRTISRWLLNRNRTFRLDKTNNRHNRKYFLPIFFLNKSDNDLYPHDNHTLATSFEHLSHSHCSHH